MDIDIHRRLCYISFIKKILICLLCLFSLLPTAEAKIDANQLLGGLLQVITEPQQDTPAQTTQQKKEEPSFGEQLALIDSAATEGFKEEGRKYARELGDIVTRQMGVWRMQISEVRMQNCEFVCGGCRTCKQNYLRNLR